MGLIDLPIAGTRIRSIDCAEGSSTSEPCTKPVATKAVWLENGLVKMIGNPTEVVAAYEAN